MDKNTFGSSKASESLVLILQEYDLKVTTSISRFLHSQNKIIKELKKIQNPDVRETLIQMYKKNLLIQNITVPTVVYTHAVNILTAKLRDNAINL